MESLCNQLIGLIKCEKSSSEDKEKAWELMYDIAEKVDENAKKSNKRSNILIYTGSGILIVFATIFGKWELIKMTEYQQNIGKVSYKIGKAIKDILDGFRK